MISLYSTCILTGVLLQHILQLPSCFESISIVAEHGYTETDSSSDSLVFRKHNQSAYDKLIPAVLRSFAIPTSSAPVERIFSHGGLVLRPNRALLISHAHDKLMG